MGSQSGLDLLSELPLSIIHIILALVPIRDAVRTSVLSRQWRHTWASLPSLVFDMKCANGKFKSEPEVCVKNIITHVLFRHKGPIHKFEMSISFESSWPDIDDWIFYLSRNDIKEIMLDMGSPDFLHVPQRVRSGLYSCEKLAYLDLSNCVLYPPPSTFKGFLFLKRLALQDVTLSTNAIESLVANAPLLEKFLLINQIEYGCPELSISALNLKSLYLFGGYTKIRIYAPLLAKMAVHLSCSRFTAEHQQQKKFVCNYTNFLGGLTNLEKLSVESCFTKYLSIGIEFCNRSLVFNHLKEIDLSGVNFKDMKEISVVVRLISGAPNLHKLEIFTNLNVRVDDGDVASDSKAQEIRLADFGCEPSFTFEKLRLLRVVIVNVVSGFPSEVEFMKLLIESSPALETMNVVLLSTLGTLVKERLTDELFCCCWASPNAKLMVSLS